MKQKTTELILIKSGDYMLDMSKLVFGGIVLVVITQLESINNLVLLGAGVIAVILTGLLGLYFTFKSQKNKKKGV